MHDLLSLSVSMNIAMVDTIRKALIRIVVLGTQEAIPSRHASL
jgi:hypothetical protein